MARSIWKIGVSEPWMGLSRRLTQGGLHALATRSRSTGPAYSPLAGSLLYVAASALPYHISGYATRTHEINRALLATGARVQVLTRTGYPWDRRDRLAQAQGLTTQVDEITYHHLPDPPNRWPVLAYAPWAARRLAQWAMAQRVACIHAASNHVNALPALLAARRLGIPFQYEMRGLWELTRISRTPQYEHTQAFRQGLRLESLVARQADRLFVISEQLGQYVNQHWGVDPQRMALLPNCVDPERFVPADMAQVRPNTLGYAGSLIGYEGLDTLIDAVHMLLGQGKALDLIIIGDGEARASLEAQAERLGLLGRQVRFLGKVSPEQARQSLAVCALVCIPRKPFQVCRIVTPIKLVEALAMGKPVLVPDLPVFRDELGPNPAGWFFKAGDAQDLARVVAQALSDPGRLQAMGQAARQYAVRQRSWQDFVPQLIPLKTDRRAGC
ncbi:glycosyltransferase family 4 protein [Castellaniella sp.]|uniref:glycosyltransferase family 4 protein n=1 Tax=Castellaniella sp. TaxID=1955812 RepID=UPI002AFF239D|nr:glycosyltransferase family 4 protein [Castellaniella sp.]